MAKNALGHREDSQSSWVSGVATFVKKKGKVKATVTDRKGNITELIFSDDLFPEHPKNILKKIQKDESYSVSIRLDEDGDVEEVQTVYPADWMAIQMRLVDISRPDGEDSDPAPIEISFEKGGKEISYLVWIAYLEILSGEWKGARVPYWLNYKFESDGEGMARWMGNPDNPRATRVRQCIEFCVAVDVVSEPIEWPEDGNVLPIILARALSAKTTLNTSGKSGQVETIISMDPKDVVEEDETPFDAVEEWDDE